MYDEESDDIAAENCAESSFQEGLSWRDGQRIVEIRVLAETLGKCCGEGCSSMLDLRNIESEKRYGFASLFWVRCVKCGALNNTKTSKSHHLKKKGVPVYDVNKKAAGAMIHSGSSVTGMQKFMASLEIPPVSARTLKKRERETGVTIEKVTIKSCLDATELKQNLCSLNNSVVYKEGFVDLKSIVMTLFGKRKIVVEHNSRSGYSVLMGTGSEILSYGTQITNSVR